MVYKTKKQKLNMGGEVSGFYDTLTDAEKMQYNTLDEAGRKAFEIKKATLSQEGELSEQGADVSGIAGSSGTASSVMGIIGAIQGVANEAGGPTDQYGNHGSDLQTYSSMSSDPSKNIATGIDDIKDGNIINGLGNILQMGGAMNASEDKVSDEAKTAQREALMLATSMQQRNTNTNAFVKDGGTIPPKKGKVRDTGTLNISKEKEKELYGEDEGPKEMFTADDINKGMLKAGFEPFPEERNDRIQENYEMSETDKAVHNMWGTKDFQTYMIENLGIDLDDFHNDGIYGKETGESLARYLETRNNLDKLEPLNPETKEPKYPDLKINNKKNIDRVLHYGPNGTIYQASPNSFNKKGLEKKYTVSAEKETLQYLTEVAGLDYETSKELMKTEEGKKELVNKFNKSQGYSEGLNQAYANQGNFPIYNKKGKLQGSQKIYDSEGKVTLKDINSMNYKEGGSVQGAGTGKSDSIETELNPGDFLIPTDTPVSKNALNSLMRILDLNHSVTKNDLDKNAAKDPNSRGVNISNKEKIIPYDKVGTANSLLKRMGYRNGLQDAAPNSKYDFLNYQ